jgi:uncharacterized RDD family membrane protein YckC
MRHSAGSWLEGPAFNRSEPRGGQLGLPAEGPGSLASPGARLLAFVVDGVVANLLAGLPYLFGVTYGPGERGYAVYAAFLLQEWILVSLVGATIGKQLLGIRVVSLADGRLRWYWVLARTLLLGFLVPAVVWDRDGRGLHDKASGALTLRVGRSASTPPTATSPATPSAGPVPGAQSNGTPAGRPARSPSSVRPAGRPGGGARQTSKKRKRR